VRVHAPFDRPPIAKRQPPPPPPPLAVPMGGSAASRGFRHGPVASHALRAACQMAPLICGSGGLTASPPPPAPRLTPLAPRQPPSRRSATA
jgi:hypothetical protein